MAHPGRPPIWFCTTNAGKLAEAERLLGRAIRGVALELDEVQSTDLDALVRHKTAQAFRRLGAPVLVEDTVLACSAWGGLPGPFVRFFLEGMGAEGLARAVTAGGETAAAALSGVGYHDGWRLHTFRGRVAGAIVPPRGAGGFGWDPIFEVAGTGRTFAEMDAAEKERHSMRGDALRQVADFLGRHPPSAV